MQPFPDLGERLLRAGVAPRHVRRYERELREHYEDIVRAELAAGAGLAAAETAARRRLGSEEELARSVLAQPELRSSLALHPRLWFGAGPVVLWLVCIVLTLAGIRALAAAFVAPSSQPVWLVPSAHALCLTYVRVVPVLLSLLALGAAIRQRARFQWPVLGAVILNLLAGTIRVQVFEASGQGGQLGVSSAVLPFLVPLSSLFGPMDVAELARGLGRAALMLALSLLPWAWWAAHGLARRLHR